MFFDPTVKEPGPSAALVDREAFLEFLKRKNLEAVWIIAGEDSATLVRGEDRHHHFIAEPQPSRDLDPEFVALHRTTTECRTRILDRGTGVARYSEAKVLTQRR